MENKYYTIINTAVEKLNFQEFDGKLTHKGRDGEPYPSINALYDFIHLCRSVIFPGYERAERRDGKRSPRHPDRRTGQRIPRSF